MKKNLETFRFVLLQFSFLILSINNLNSEKLSNKSKKKNNVILKLENLEKLNDAFHNMQKINEWVVWPELFSLNPSVNILKFFEPKYKNIYPEWNIIKDLYDENIIKNLNYNTQNYIPKIIHQIWLGSPLPEKYKKFQNSWINLHPNWEYKLWTDKEVESLQLINKKAYDETSNYGKRSDIARYEILYRFGGLYVDTDFECLYPFDVLNHSCDFYSGLSFDPKAIMFNGLIASIPGHPILKTCIDNLTTNLNTDETAENILYQTGPNYFTKCFFETIASSSKRVVIFPTTYFYPWPHWHKKDNSYDEIMQWVRPETFAIHHWHVSWNNGNSPSAK